VRLRYCRPASAAEKCGIQVRENSGKLERISGNLKKTISSLYWSYGKAVHVPTANQFPKTIENHDVALSANEMFTFELDSDKALVGSTMERCNVPKSAFQLQKT
jgi:hypothetical protein